MSKTWTNDEIQKLKDCVVHNLSLKEISVELGCTYGEIKYMRYKLSPMYNSNNPFAWTREEINRLRQFVSDGLSDVEISHKLDRSSQAIQSRRCYVGLQKQHHLPNGSHKGYEEIGGGYIVTVKNGAKNRGLTYDITAKVMWEQFQKQDGKCALSGVVLIMDPKKSPDGKRTASLDRIDSSLGYLKDNIQWIHKVLNTMKSNLSEEEFKYWCCLGADYNNRKII